MIQTPEPVTQAEVNRLYKEIVEDGDEDDPEGCDERYYANLKNRFGPYTTLTVDWKCHCDDTEEDYNKVLTKLGAVVINDPAYNLSDTYGYLIFHPGM